MKKCIFKIKKIVIAIIVAIISFQNKIFAISAIDMTPALYEIEEPESPRITILGNIAKIAKFLAIPIFVLIGLLVYCKKRKPSPKEKKMAMIKAVLIAIILYLIEAMIIIIINMR